LVAVTIQLQKATALYSYFIRIFQKSPCTMAHNIIILSLPSEGDIPSTPPTAEYVQQLTERAKEMHKFYGLMGTYTHITVYLVSCLLSNPPLANNTRGLTPSF
jgi:hypothetical protein